MAEFYGIMITLLLVAGIIASLVFHETNRIDDDYEDEGENDQ